MKQSDSCSKPYAAGFAINKSCLRQSNAFDKSVSSIPPTLLLSKLFLNFAAIKEGHVECCYLVGIRIGV